MADVYIRAESSNSLDHDARLKPMSQGLSKNLSTLSKSDVFRNIVEQAIVKRSDENPNSDTRHSDADDYDTDMGEETSSTFNNDWNRSLYAAACSKLGVRCCKRFIECLKRNCINMTGQALRCNDVIAMSLPLLDNLSITVLVLNSNKIGVKGAYYIASMLSENTSIKNISLADNEIGDEGMRYLCNTLMSNRAIIRCNVSGNNLSDGIAEELSNIIKTSKTLVELNISHNGFEENGAKLIGNALAENDYMKYLDISWNHFRPSWMKHIFVGLQYNAAMKKLDVSMNGLDLVGSKSCAEMLARNRSLVELNLSKTRISDKGMSLIAQSLAISDVLEQLKLPGNPITACGAAVLIDFLKQNDSSALTYIDLSTTHVLQDFIDDLKELRKYLPNVHVDVGGIVSTYYAIDPGKSDKYRNKNPLTLLRWYVAAKNLRLIDLFRQLDKDNSMTVSREELLEGLGDINIHLSDEQFERLMSVLDKDGDGEIDYSELSQSDRENRKSLRRNPNEKDKKELSQDLWGVQESNRKSSVQVERNQESGPLRKISTIIPPNLLRIKE